MAWIATEDFDSYTNGASVNGLNGGTGWNGAWTIGVGTYTVTNAQSFSSPNSLKDLGGNTGNAYVNRAVSAVTSGTISWYMRAAGATQSVEFSLGSTANPNQAVGACILGGFNANDILWFDNGTGRTLVSGYSINTWYKITINFTGGGTNTYTIQVDSGTVFGPYAYSFGGSGDIINFQIYRGGGTADIFVDSIAPPAVPSGPANVKTWDGVTQSTGIKTYLGTALASVKSVDGIV